MRKEFYYPSKDGLTQIHAMEWIPEGDVRGILQIAHGMVDSSTATTALRHIWLRRASMSSGTTTWAMESP